MTWDQFSVLLDASAKRTELAILELPAECRVAVAADALEAFFVDDTEATAVVVAVGDDIIGLSSRARLVALGSAILRSIGDGAGAALPGASLRYRILRFQCPTCGTRIRRIHVDPRSTPTCPNGHGALEAER